MLNKLLLVPLSIFFVSCGDINVEPPGDPKPDPAVDQISVVAFAGPIVNANVDIYEYSVYGRGVSIVSGITNMQGKVTLPFERSSAGTLLACVYGIDGKNGAHYKELASEEVVYLSSTQELCAITNYTISGNIDISITNFTNDAFGLSQYYIDRGMEVKAAVISANQIFSDWIGCNVVETIPMDPNNSGNITDIPSCGLLYGYVIAAYSQMMVNYNAADLSKTESLGNSMTIYQQNYFDIKYDSIFDGFGATGQMYIGVIPANVNLVRKYVAVSLFEFASSSNNKSQLDAYDLAELAGNINYYINPIFNDIPPQNFNDKKPVISNTSLVDGQTVSGIITISANVSDIFGVNSKIVKIVDSNIIKSFEIDQPLSFELDTKLLALGVHAVVIEASNIMGGKNSKNININVVN